MRWGTRRKFDADRSITKLSKYQQSRTSVHWHVGLEGLTCCAVSTCVITEPVISNNNFFLGCLKASYSVLIWSFSFYLFIFIIITGTAPMDNNFQNNFKAILWLGRFVFILQRCICKYVYVEENLLINLFCF